MDELLFEPPALEPLLLEPLAAGAGLLEPALELLPADELPLAPGALEELLLGAAGLVADGFTELLPGVLLDGRLASERRGVSEGCGVLSSRLSVEGLRLELPGCALRLRSSASRFNCPSRCIRSFDCGSEESASRAPSIDGLVELRPSRVESLRLSSNGRIACRSIRWLSTP